MYDNFNSGYKQPELLINGELQTLEFAGNDSFGAQNFGFSTSKFDIHKKFNRYRVSEGIDYFTSNVTYVFFTKPQMNIMNEGFIHDEFIQSMQKSDVNTGSHYVLEQLDGIASNSGCFNFLLSNSVENFDLKDNILKTQEVGETRMGSKIILGDDSTDSYNTDNFTVEYTELSDMSITKMHKAWIDYIHLIKHNQAAPYMCKSTETANLLSSYHKSGDYYYSYKNNPSVNNIDFIRDKKIDYVCSVYYFRVAEDGTTIKYWCKYTGVFPLNVPFSSMSFNMGDNKLKQISVNYTYSFKEDMNPAILEEFQQLCLKSGWTHSPSLVAPNGIQFNWSSGVCLNPDYTRLLFIK